MKKDSVSKVRGQYISFLLQSLFRGSSYLYWGEIMGACRGPLGAIQGLSSVRFLPLAQRDLSGYVEGGGGSSYRDPPLPFNLLSGSLSLFQNSFSKYREKERQG